MSPPVNAEKSYLRLGVRFGENLRVSVAANQGGRKYMEDRVHIETIRKEDGSIKFTFFGIFDGHGGHEASEYVRRNLLENIMKCELFESDDDDDILEAIRLGFLTTHHGIWKVVSEWPRTASGYTSTAGTTASVAILRNGKLYTGHVGDSAIVLLKRSYRTDNLEDLVPHRLTVDHKPESEDEQARIRVAGGSVALKSGVARVVWTRPLKHHAGPIRRSTPTESIPFLAVARSLGDVWSYCEDTKEFIVSPEPDLAVEELTGDDVCIVLASDGLTNVLGPIQVAAVIDEEESVTQIGISKSEDLVYRNKHTNLARVLVANAFRNWRHLRADNVTAIAVMLDSPFADLPVDHPCVEEYIGINESIDRVFIDDPECVVRISPSATLKLFTYRTPILYKGARDPNFSVVDYNGPGFITHNDECLIEEHYRATCGGAEYDGVMKEIGLDSIATLTSNMNTNIICSRVNVRIACDSSRDTSDYHVKGIQRSSPVVIKNEEELASTKNGEDAYFGRTSPKTSSKHSIIEEDETDEEEIQVLPVTSSKRSAKFIHSGEDVIAVRKRVTRSVSKFLEESEASSRPIKVVAKRSSTMTRKEPCRSACVNVEDQVLTPSGSVDIKIHVDGSLTPTFGMITRSRNRNATTLVVDVRTSPQAYSEKVASSSTVQCHVESSSCLRNNSSMASNGSRKRPHREVDEFSGITPVVHRLSLDSSHQSSSGFNDINSINTHAKVRSAPSTPSKSGSNAGRMSSKWSLSKLDTKTSLREDSVTSIEVGEPPSKMRRIYGFMRRLVGFGLGNGQ